MKPIDNVQIAFNQPALPHFNPSNVGNRIVHPLFPGNRSPNPRPLGVEFQLSVAPLLSSPGNLP